MPKYFNLYDDVNNDMDLLILNIPVLSKWFHMNQVKKTLKIIGKDEMLNVLLLFTKFEYIFLCEKLRHCR